MVASSQIDDLFRQKPLVEIHALLKQTRDEVESKKQELRELVGDHYRSVLESSDHIRQMSDCAAKVSAGADRVEELIASMRQLATSPPSLGGGANTGVGGGLGVGGLAPSRAAARARAAAEQDHEYKIGVRVMELLEVPESVRDHLGAHEFVAAARVALLDAAALQGEVGELLKQEENNTSSAPVGHGAIAGEGAAAAGRRFDFAALMRQQAATFRSLPRQIVASAVDAFGVAALEPASAAQGFLVHLLLEPTVQPVSLLRLFLDRRVGLLTTLLNPPGGTSVACNAGASCGARLAAASMAFEGTVVLSSRLCEAESGGEPQMLKAALEPLTGGPGCRAADERAAIEGRPVDGGSSASFRRRVDSLGALLCGATGAQAMTTELAKLGSSLVGDWLPLPSSDVIGGGTTNDDGRSLSSRFNRLVTTAPSGTLNNCKSLGGVLSACSERLLAYRRALTCGAPEKWSDTWASSCSRFCPDRPPLVDALVLVASTIEKACADIVRERVGDLNLELVSPTEGDMLQTGMSEDISMSSVPCGGMVGADEDRQRHDEVQEVHRQSCLRVSRFDEHLGEVLSDLEHVSRGGIMPRGINVVLLSALADRLQTACDEVRLPFVKPLWVAGRDEASDTGGVSGAATRPVVPWSVQLGAARAAIALDALAAAASTSSHKEDVGSSHLRSCLSSALSSGDPQIAKQAEDIQANLRRRSADAFLAWARLAVGQQASSPTTLESFRRLSNDEVPLAYSWGSAKFVGIASQQDSDAKAIPVPVQASPFVFELLTLGARRANEVSGGGGSMPPSLIAALKVALSESLMAAFQGAPPRPTGASEGLKRSGIYHDVQRLFDLQFLRLALSATSVDDANATVGATGGTNAAYEALRNLLDQTEASALADPVDRTLYQPVLKAAVKIHVQGVRILLAPFFLHNPLYSFHFQRQAGSDTNEGDGFEIQASFAPPLRPTLPRFPLLPVAAASALGVSSAELDARLGLGAHSADSAAARASAAAGGSGAAGAAVSSLTQHVGSALGSWGLGKAGPGLLGGLGGNWTSGWGGAGGGGGMRPPEAS
eukprot:TRINITY_DN34215_c0_g1_i1.p1 TRINITY_DN34215_c0_g1~~TRINITY_DN34215_c0_g1_i1.p1  ORF type:complete len:1060 (-),score=232.87 TRINITY_DN34215_c0_g1_i1:546-3725(-)